MTALIIVSLVVLVALVAVALRAEATKTGVFAPSAAERIAQSEVDVRIEYADKLRVLHSLALDMEGSGYPEYREFMMDWVAYSEQEPDELLLSHLFEIVDRANAVFTWHANQEAAIANLNSAIYLEGVRGVDDGRDRCENDYLDDPAQRVEPVASRLYWFADGCIYEVCPDGSDIILLRDELFGHVVLDQGKGVYLIQVAAENVWLAENYVEEGLLEAAV